ncbi:ESX secretion-associated protein EspG [Nocardia gipuzkoensis]
MTTMSMAQLRAVADTLGVQTLPTVLAVGPTESRADAALALRDTAFAELTARGVLDRYGDVRDEVAAALHTLARPDRELVLRVRRGGELTRACLARRGGAHAIAIRTGDSVLVEPCWGDEDPDALARPLLPALGRAQPADIPTLRTPTEQLLRHLDQDDAVNAIYRCGLAHADAVTLGVAIREHTALAELVCYANTDGVATRSPVAAAVYDTPVGRIIGSGMRAIDGRAWTTLGPGSDRRFSQAIAGQIEALPQGRWMP